MTTLELSVRNQFTLNGIDFKIDDDGGLWVDGGEFDDNYIRDLEELADVSRYDEEVEVEITDADIKAGQDYLNEVRGNAEMNMVEDAFEGKLGTSQDYAWIVEGIDGLEDYTDELVKELIDNNAEIVLENIKGEYEEKYGIEMTMSMEDFKKHSDYEYAVRDVQRRRNDARDEQTLNAVMAAAEVMEKYDLSESTVRQALNRESLRGRKSGETWLMLRKDAEARWGKR